MPPEETNNSQAAANTQQASTQNATGNGGNDEAAKQAELNRQFAERAKRAEEATRKQLWEALGVNTQEEFDAYVKAKKDADDAQKTALEKAADEAAKAKAKADKLEAESKTALEAAQRRIMDGEIKLIATQEMKDKDGKVTRPAFRADALDLLLLAIDRKDIKDEDGKITGVEQALAALAKEKPFLLAAANQQTQTAPKGTPAPQPPANPNQQKPNEPSVVVGTTL